MRCEIFLTLRNLTMRVLNLHYFSCQWIIVLVLLFTLFNSKVFGADPGEEFCRVRSTHPDFCPPSKESYSPWPHHETCKKYDVKIYPDGTFTPMALVGFPYTGVTILLSLVERASGILTGRVETVPSNLRGGPDYNVRCGVRAWDGRTIMQGSLEVLYTMSPKWYMRLITHDGEELSSPTMSRVLFNYRGVIIVRNPWHTLINARAKLRAVLRKCAIGCKELRGLKESTDFELNEFQKYFEDGAKLWVDQVRRWVKNSPHGSDLVLVHYEKMALNPEPDVRRVLRFLNQTVDEGRLKCALEDPPHLHKNFPDHKAKAIVAYFFENSFDSKGSQILENGMMEINDILRSKGVTERLDYVKPSPSNILVMRNEYKTEEEMGKYDYRAKEQLSV